MFIIIIKKKNEIMPFVGTWMDLEIIISELSQIEKGRHHISLICRIYKEIIQTNLFVKQKLTQRMLLWLSGRMGEEEG